MKVGDLVHYRSLKGGIGMGVVYSLDEDGDPVVLIYEEGCTYKISYYRSQVWLVK